MSFVSELKRRKVFQVAAVYLVVAWLIMQVVDVVNEPLRLPEWFATVAILIVAIGFPIALIVSWAFDLTPEGVVKDQGTGQSGGRRIEYVFIGLLVIAVATLLYRDFTPPEQPVEVVSEESQREVLPNSVAVLPFENLTLDSEYSFFAPGIHDTILKELAKIRDMNVIARTSVLQYADGQTSIEQIAEDLRVETVMEGSVQYAEGRVLVTAQLIDPSTNTHLWSESYDRELEGIFEIQADIATRIAMALEAELLPSEQASIKRVPTDSPEAYALYLSAIEESSNERRQVLLNEAIALDPNFALAYARKAYNYASSLINTASGAALPNVDELESLGRQNARHALRLDPSLGSAYQALAVIDARFWRYSEAEEAFERAVELSPNDPTSVSTFGFFRLVELGQQEEGIRMVRHGVALDPNLAFGYWNLGASFFVMRNPDEAVAAFREAVRLSPAATYLRRWLAMAEIQHGNDDAALAELQIVEQLGDTFSGIPFRAYSYSRLERRDEAQRVFESVEAAADSEGLDPGAGGWAMLHLAVGNDDRALEWLRVAAEKIENQELDAGYYYIVVIRANPLSDPILDQPEFVEVRSRLGFRE